MNGDPISDIKLQGNKAEILGERIFLTGTLLATTGRSLWLDHDSLLVTWDFNKARSTNRDRNQPYEPNHFVEFEGKLEVSDVILVKFEKVDREPLSGSLIGDLIGDDDEPLSLSREELLGMARHDEHDVSSETWGFSPDEIDAQRRRESLSSVFDDDPPPTWVRRHMSLTETLQTLQETTRNLASRVAELEQRVQELENS